MHIMIKNRATLYEPSVHKNELGNVRKRAQTWKSCKNNHIFSQKAVKFKENPDFLRSFWTFLGNFGR